jgi:hypothetical protein
VTGKFFDVAVVTEGINGLLAAYELSKSDISIVVIDNYKPSLEIDGYDFNYYPGHIFVTQDLPDVFKELNTAFEVYTNPAYQLFLPDRRIDLHYNIQKLVKTLPQRFNEEVPLLQSYLYNEGKICDLLSQLTRTDNNGHPKHLMRLLRKLRLKELLFQERKRAGNSFKNLKERHLTHVLVHAIARYMSPWLDEEKLFTYRDIAPMILKKRFYPVGGKGSVKSAIIKQLAGHNVNIIQDRDVNSIEYSKYFTIKFDHDQTVRSRRVICEPMHEKTIAILPFDAYRKTKKHFYVDNIFIGLKRSCLPELYGRANNAIMVHDYQQAIANDNLIFMDTNPITDLRRAKDEMAAMTATVLIKENSISKISSIRHEVLEHIRWFIPFFDDYVENIYLTEPSIIWDGHNVPVYKKGFLMLNDEFMNLYTADAKYAYIKKQVKKLIRTL